jgi:hypothetical protein
LNESEKERVKERAKCLSFDVPFWRFNIDTIKEACTYIIDTEIDLIEEPMHYSALFCNDREMEVLSGFGPSAFTFNIPGAPVVKLSAKENPKRIVARMVPLETAIMDLRTIRSDKSFHNNPVHVARSYVTREFSGKEVGNLMSLLQNIGNSNMAASATESSVSLQKEETFTAGEW